MRTWLSPPSRHPHSQSVHHLRSGSSSCICPRLPVEGGEFIDMEVRGGGVLGGGKSKGLGGGGFSRCCRVRSSGTSAKGEPSG